MSILENGVEKGAKLTRELFDLNNSTMVKFVELSSENFKKLPEVSDVSSFVELQRDYGQNLWEGMQADLRARGELVRDAVQQTGTIVRGTFGEEESVVEQAIEEAVAA